MNGFIICIPHGTQAGQIKDEMGEACSTDTFLVGKPLRE
jgi:hypothetical protein